MALYVGTESNRVDLFLMESLSSKVDWRGRSLGDIDVDRRMCSTYPRRSVESLTEFVERLRGWPWPEWWDIVAVLASLTRYADRDFIMLSLTSFLSQTTHGVSSQTPVPGRSPLRAS